MQLLTLGLNTVILISDIIIQNQTEPNSNKYHKFVNQTMFIDLSF